TWTYSRTLNGGAASTTTITDPSSNQTLIDFVGIYPTESQVYQGAAGGTPLETTYTCYNGAAPNCNSTAITLPITQETVYPQWATGQESETNTYYNSYGLVTEEDDYDYGSGAPGALLRKTITTYASLGNNIVNRPSSITVCSPGGSASACNGTGTVVAQTKYQYDQGTPVSSGISTQHVAVSGSRGNPTTVSNLVSGSTYLTKTFTYYDTGNVDVATDVNGATTTYTYGYCNGAFPTKVAGPLVPAITMTWNCTGGVETSATDANGQTVSTSYTDPYFWRPNSTTDQLSNTTNITYTGQTSIEQDMSISGSSSASDVLTTLDDLGRPELTQTREAPGSSTFDSVETDYDTVGRQDRTTLPFAAGAGSTCSSCAATTTTYDVLGRPLTVTDGGGGTVTYSYTGNDVLETLGPAPSGENPKRKQLEYDALGRLTSVCEITNASGSGPCSQTSAGNGYYTQYTYDALGDLTGVSQDSGAQTRWFIYDGLGRMTSETNPESGTVTYTFDTDSTCGTSKGDLVKKVDAVGNVTCLAYDALHRVTSTTYSGPYASVTASKYFVYDSATVNGVSMSNAESRMAEAYTCFSPCSSKITDEGFSYDARGETTDVWESTPHSGGYLHSSASYWANGALDVLGGALGYWTDYPLDGEGRVNSTNDGNGLASTTYNAAGLLTQLNFASGDSDSFAYDSNTDRMTQYKFTVNGSSVIGNLTWNANGTLANLLITDPFNSADTQSCSYTHDDLARIASANCGSVWSQTYGYDPFGNVTTTGTGQFEPGYNASTNQMLAPATYAANGNLTNDEEHSYGWDGYGDPIAIDDVDITYDALGRVVEENNAGTYEQVQYSPTGFKMCVLSGGQYIRLIVPMPGGAAEVWTPSTVYYRHADWLGTSRLASNTNRTIYYDGAYAPFGQPYAESGITARNFTGMDQDFVSGLYDFPAREYNGNEGRWPSPDPAGLAAVNPADPQSWNRYAYVRNSPLGLTDPLGLAPPISGPPIIVPSQPGCLEFSWYCLDGGFGGLGGSSPISPPTITSPSCNLYWIGGCQSGQCAPNLAVLCSSGGTGTPPPPAAPTVSGTPQ
ncbi:MAG: RHS repeat-associated core domain-containing protein, partial [Bryobacteraceae bacterium]